MVKSKPKTWATLSIEGENLNPAFVTEKLSIPPDFFSGPEIPSVHGKPSHPFWQIHSKLPPDASPNEHLQEILNKIAPSRKNFREFLAPYKKTIYLSVQFASEDIDGIQISNRFLLLMGDLGVDLEFVPWQEIPNVPTRNA